MDFFQFLWARRERKKPKEKVSQLLTKTRLKKNKGISGKADRSGSEEGAVSANKQIKEMEKKNY